MIRSYLSHGSLLLTALTLIGASATAPMAAELQFSARTVQTTPKNERMTGRVFFGDERMRTEMTREGETRINIVDNRRRVAWILNPGRKEYVEFKGEADRSSAQAPVPGRPALPDEPGSPCQEGRGLVCNKLGAEVIGGRPTDKWEFVMTRGEQTQRSLVWIDTRLKIPVREELPGGYVRELLDIKEGPQPDSLFQIPADFKRIEMPVAGQRSPQGGMAAPPGDSLQRPGVGQPMGR